MASGVALPFLQAIIQRAMKVLAQAVCAAAFLPLLGAPHYIRKQCNGRYHSMSAVPHDKPPPKPHNARREPGRSRPFSEAFRSVRGILAAAVFPYISTVVTVWSIHNPSDPTMASIMRRLLW